MKAKMAENQAAKANRKSAHQWPARKYRKRQAYQRNGYQRRNQKACGENGMKAASSIVAAGASLQ